METSQRDLKSKKQRKKKIKLSTTVQGYPDLRVANRSVLSASTWLCLYWLNSVSPTSIPYFASAIPLVLRRGGACLFSDGASISLIGL